MSRKPKLSGEQVEDLRKRHARGESKAALAAEVGVSPTTVANYLRVGLSREERGAVSPAGSSARAAVDRFLDGLGPLAGERAALAGVARVLSDRIDTTPSAASAAAAAREVSAIVSKLAAGQTQEEAHVRARRALAAVGL
jgi:hypothetical protein